MNRKLLASLLLVGLLMTFLPILSLSASAETELQIHTKEELLDFANRLAGGDTFAKQTVYLNADFDMANAVWPLAGKNNVTFSGMIDGQGHTVSGLKSESESNYQGLFGSCLMPVGDDSFTVGIKNLTVKASSISGTSQIGGLFGRIGSDTGTAGKVLFANLNLEIAVSASGAYCGGIAGDSRADEMTVAGCIIRGTVSGTMCVGGLIGWELDKKLTVGNTVMSANVKATNINAGGFFGHVRERAGGQGSDTLITNCVFDGVVETSFTETYGNVGIGGFVGLVGANNGDVSSARPGNLTVKNSAFYGMMKLTGKGNVGKIGGLVGSTNGGDNSTVTFRSILLGGKIEIAGTPLYNYGKLIGIAASYSTYRADGIVGDVEVVTVGDVEGVTNWGWGNFSSNQATNTQANQLIASVSEGYRSLRFSDDTVTVDFSGSFATTPATKPLPMGVLHFYSDVVNGKDNGTAVTNAAVYQDRLETDGTRSVRLIGLLRCAETELANFESVGLEITVIRLDGADVKTVNNLTDGKAPSTQTVYKSVMADGEKKDAASILSGYSYLFTATVDGLPQNRGSVTFAVRSFHDQNGARTYDDMLVFEYSTDAAA